MVLESSCDYTLQHKDVITMGGRQFRFEYSTCGLRAWCACGGSLWCFVLACGRTRVCCRWCVQNDH
jgi:hypothetical protein